MTKLSRWTVGLAALAALAAGGCPQGSFNFNFGQSGNGNTVVEGDKTENENANENANSDSSETENVAKFGFSGKLKLPDSAKRRPRAEGTDDSGWEVVAVNSDGQLYRGTVDSDGKFKIEIPDDAKGDVFSLTVLNDAGRAAGTIEFGTKGDKAYTGLTLDETTQLGEMEIPENPGDAPLMAGNAEKLQGAVAQDVVARINDKGVPVGMESLGKGDGADGPAAAGAAQGFDKDQDGLPDFVDADNDGDGVIDDSDNDGGDKLPDGLTINFFMNLKIAQADSSTYYSGSEKDIESRLATDTVITFEVFQNQGGGGKTPALKGVHLKEIPGPTYLATATAFGNSGPSSAQLWSKDDFAFELNPNTQRFERFVVPNALMNAGDSFQVELEYEDGTTAKYNRMINFIFKNIPKLMKFGPSGSLADYSGGDVSVDATQNVVLEFRPPLDESGAPLTGMSYFFEVFYQSASGQVNGIDTAATWPSGAPHGYGNGRTVFEVSAGDLGTLSADDTYQVTLPKEIFVDSVQTSGSGAVAVTGYQIDIAAQNTGGNAAIKLTFHK